MSASAMKQALEAMQRGPWTLDTKAKYESAINALRAAIAEAEKYNPVAWLNKKIPHMAVLTKPYDGGGWFPVFTHPAPSGWLRAIDEALTSSHLGIADASDSYETAKKKLNDLIAWNIQVATDPAVNGGLGLVPVERFETVQQAIREMSHARRNPDWFTNGKQGADAQWFMWEQRGLEAIRAIAAAPEYKP